MKCKKGNIGRKADQFWCDSCDSDVEYPILRYKLELEVSDNTVEVVIVMFEQTLPILLKCLASSMLASQTQDTDEHPGLPVGLANIVGTSHILEMKSHSYFEQASYKSFTYWRIVREDATEGNSSAANAGSKSHITMELLEGKEPKIHDRRDDIVEERSNSAKAGSKASEMKGLKKGTSVTTPSKPGETKKHVNLKTPTRRSRPLLRAGPRRKAQGVLQTEGNEGGWC